MKITNLTPGDLALGVPHAADGPTTLVLALFRRDAIDPVELHATLASSFPSSVLAG